MLIHKRGDTLDLLSVIPDAYPDGYFVGWTVHAQLRTSRYRYLLANLSCSWTDSVKTRLLKITANNTSTWEVGSAVMDVQFVRDSDGYTISSDTIEVSIIPDITFPPLVP